MNSELLTAEEEDDLEYTRSKRKAIVNDLTKPGENNTEAELGLILSACNDMDRQALTKARLRSNKKQNEDANNNAALTHQLLASIGNNYGQIPIPSNIDPKVISEKVTAMPIEVESIEINPGEDELENTNTDFEAFSADMKEKE